jgi:hypothetical protein
MQNINRKAAGALPEIAPKAHSHRRIAALEKKTTLHTTARIWRRTSQSTASRVTSALTWSVGFDRIGWLTHSLI